MDTATASLTVSCDVPHCRECLLHTQCVWYIDGLCMDRSGASRTHHSRDLILYQINCPMVCVRFITGHPRTFVHRMQPIKKCMINSQNVHNPEATTSGTLLFISFVIIVIVALMARIYYHCYHKRHHQQEASTLVNIEKEIKCTPIRLQSASNSTSFRLQMPFHDVIGLCHTLCICNPTNVMNTTQSITTISRSIQHPRYRVDAKGSDISIQMTGENTRTHR